MAWYWWALVALVVMWILFRIRDLIRGAPVDQEDIRYRWNSKIARAAAMSRGSHNNYGVTLGRVTFVRFDHIKADHASHEFKHSLQAHPWGALVFFCRAMIQYARYGYKEAPIEKSARAFASQFGYRFSEVRKSERNA